MFDEVPFVIAALFGFSLGMYFGAWLQSMDDKIKARETTGGERSDG